MYQDEIVANWDGKKYLVLSSFLFLVPAVYALRHQLYGYVFLLVITSLVSANHWRHSACALRKDADIAVATTSFCIFFVSGLMFIRNPYYFIVGCIGLLAIWYCFTKSEHLREEQYKSDTWFIFHVMFHFLVMCEQFIVLQALVTYMLLQAIVPFKTT
jgi:hypothetical protein